MSAFVARFGGVCAECEERFPEATMIRYNTDREIVHDKCPDPAPTVLDLRRGEKVCPDCHLVHPGEC